MQNVVQVNELAGGTNLKVTIELCYLADNKVIEIFEVFMAKIRKSLNCVLLDLEA
jgi:hypothetical protein